MYNVLVVDDDRATRYMLKRFKKWDFYGFAVGDEACDGKEALKKLSLSRFDLVITDIKMPGMDGIEFLHELRRIKYEICVIFLSTHSDFEYAKQGIRLGVFDYMTKPVNEAVLGEVLERTKSHLDEYSRQKSKIEKEKSMIEESLDIYYSKSTEKKLASLLMSGDPGLFAEAEKTYSDITGASGNDRFKNGMLLVKLLEKLFEVPSVSYPWLGKIEKVNFDDLKHTLESCGDMKGKFLECVNYIRDIVKKYELHQTDSIVKKICEYVLNHVEDEISLEKIAGEVHVRSDYTGKLFKKKTGCNLNDYITKIKMEHAKYLISTGNFKNYEISEKLGYSSPDYFCRLFKSYTGCTPAEYKKIGI